MGKRDSRLSIRLSSSQMLTLEELKDALDTNYSLLLRAIVQDFISKNEDSLERIITEYREKKDADNKKA